jgi:hypothetical protein
MIESRRDFRMTTTIRKRIRSDVEDSHYLAVPGEIERAALCHPDHFKTDGLQRPPGRHTLPRMNPLATLKIFTVTAGLLACALCEAREPAKEVFEVEGPNVRVMRHEDGSKTYFTRSPDNKTLTKKKLSANGVLTMLTTYRMDSNGNPLSCKIADGQGQELFKVSYGYRKSDAQLVEERMFDARSPRKDPNTGKEMPVQIIKYVYDAQGNRSAPIIYNLLPGKTVEQVFGVKSSALHTNPFKKGNSPEAPANPNARPLKR